ncbi:MAG: tetratricopeptide repeat protein [Bacteroidales bacterium]|nr:tetratricopeptide repeat protein [Bacteroidales bacterium]
MKRIILTAVTIFLLIPVFLFSQNARQFYKAGLNFKASNNHKDAIEQFSKAIELNPDYVDAYVERAYSYEINDQVNLAFEDYKRALVFETKSEEIYYNAARVCYNTGKYKQALDYVNKAIDLRKKYLEAYQLQTNIFLKLDKLEDAQLASQKALALKDNDLNHFLAGQVAEQMNNLNLAEEEYVKAIIKNRKYVEAYVALADLRIKLNKLDQAINDCNSAIRLDQNYTDAYLTRSKAYIKKLDYPHAIDDVSRTILLKPNNKQLYFIRGNYYQEFTQHQNAISDYTKVIMLDDKASEAYYKRAFSYEQTGNFKAAKKDYQTLTKLSEYDVVAKKLMDSADERLFELNREESSPEIAITEPLPYDYDVLKVPRNKSEITLKGKIFDESDIKALKINNIATPFLKNDDKFEFSAGVDVSKVDLISISAVDVYDNMKNVTYVIERTEIDPPKIAILAPYASDNGEIYLENNDPTVYVEGKIADESPIKSIFINDVSASFKLDETNPLFTATINVSNKDKFSVRATDIYGNETEKDFMLNREGISLLENNPMGKTWVVFIENSIYESFPSLDGPSKDVTLMRSALARYDIHKIIHKKDLTKKDMERFFSIELRDLIRTNRVEALLVWYAGHGKFINETGYWIPVDAKRDDEFTYFNISALRASLQSYSNIVTHVLVITDACESGPTFYQAMREIPKVRDCADWEATRLKSSQVFSSAGYELAIDNSQFTRTFANTLANNPNTCIPIESIVSKVTTAVTKNNQQKPKFGKITGLEDEDGTFFFISKN